jgi:hypothetical protein
VIPILSFGCRHVAPDQMDLQNKPASPSEVAEKRLLNQEFWQGVQKVVAARRTSSYFFDWARQQAIKVQSSADSGASYFPAFDVMTVPKINYIQMIKIGRGEISTRLAMYPLGLILNEVFHAWFDQKALLDDDCSPLLLLMEQQKQYEYGRRPYQVWLPTVRDLSEEAVSEFFASYIDYPLSRTLESNRDHPSYQTIRKLRSIELTPSHNDAPDSKWYLPIKLRRASALPIDEKLYFALLRLLEEGCSYEEN